MQRSLDPPVRSVLGNKPLNFSECEVLMMVGLPGSGKSTWAAEYAERHPERRYMVLGTQAILEQMRVGTQQGTQLGDGA